MPPHTQNPNVDLAQAGFYKRRMKVTIKMFPCMHIYLLSQLSVACLYFETLLFLPLVMPKIKNLPSLDAYFPRFVEDSARQFHHQGYRGWKLFSNTQTGHVLICHPNERNLISNYTGTMDINQIVLVKLELTDTLFSLSVTGFYQFTFKILLHFLPYFSLLPFPPHP